MFSERGQTQKQIHRGGQASSLSHACMFCRGGTKEVNSHGSDFEKLDLAIHLFSFATKGRGEDLERSAIGGGEIKGVQEMKCGQGRGRRAPL